MATGLTASTTYRVQVWTYSIACDDYSRSSAAAEFETTAAEANDAAEPTDKHAPKRVRNLRAARADHETVTLTWRAPGTKNGKHHEATDYLIVVLRFEANGDKTELGRDEGYTGTTVSYVGMVSGTKYRFRVAPYSTDCECYGRWRGVTYTYS